MISPVATAQAPLADARATSSKRRRRHGVSAVALQLANEPLPLVATVVLVLVIIAALLAQVVSPFSPVFQDLAARLKPPLYVATNGVHLLGTDALGRDILSRLIFGSRISLVIGVSSVVVAGGIGVLFGLVAGYARGVVDNIIMRFADVQLSVPFLVLALATVAVVGPSLLNLVVVLGITGWVQYARIIRAETLSVTGREYVDAARVLGATPRRIVFQHILPNVMSSVIVVATLQVSRMILFEASLSFLGLGVPPPTPTWGGMVADGRTYVDTAWWVSTIPGLAIFVAVLAVSILGERLRDVLDPRLQTQ
jgi:peptide/nickel transport system permease protein